MKRSILSLTTVPAPGEKCAQVSLIPAFRTGSSRMGLRTLAAAVGKHPATATLRELHEGWLDVTAAIVVKKLEEMTKCPFCKLELPMGFRGTCEICQTKLATAAIARASAAEEAREASAAAPRPYVPRVGRDIAAAAEASARAAGAEGASTSGRTAEKKEVVRAH